MIRDLFVYARKVPVFTAFALASTALGLITFVVGFDNTVLLAAYLTALAGFAGSAFCILRRGQPAIRNGR